MRAPKFLGMFSSRKRYRPDARIDDHGKEDGGGGHILAAFDVFVPFGGHEIEGFFVGTVEQFHDHDPDPAAEHQQPLSGVFTRYGKQGCQNNQYEHLMPERLLAFPREHEAGQGIFGGSHQMLGIDESGHSFLPFSFQNAADVSAGYDNCLKYKPLPWNMADISTQHDEHAALLYKYPLSGLYDWNTWVFIA